MYQPLANTCTAALTGRGRSSFGDQVRAARLPHQSAVAPFQLQAEGEEMTPLYFLTVKEKMVLST